MNEQDEQALNNLHAMIMQSFKTIGHKQTAQLLVPDNEAVIDAMGKFEEMFNKFDGGE